LIVARCVVQAQPVGRGLQHHHRRHALLSGVGRRRRYPGGGIFAQPSNIGTYGSHQLAGAAELSVRTGYRLTDLLIPYIAYNALYVSSITRPGDAISPYINTTATALAAASRGSGFPSPLGGPLGPAVNAGSTGVWVQDISADVALRF
jgi:Putative beta barrel porin-7 (BBP7)